MPLLDGQAELGAVGARCAALSVVVGQGELTPVGVGRTALSVVVGQGELAMWPVLEGTAGWLG